MNIKNHNYLIAIKKSDNIEFKDFKKFLITINFHINIIHGQASSLVNENTYKMFKKNRHKNISILSYDGIRENINQELYNNLTNKYNLYYVGVNNHDEYKALLSALKKFDMSYYLLNFIPHE